MKSLFFALLFGITTIANAQDGKAIVERYKKELDATDQEATLTMKLVSKTGTIRERSLTWSSQTGKDGREASYIYFSAPTDIKGTAFLSVENLSGNDDQWLYLPSLKRSRRISSNEKGKSFMGTDFTYQDIGNENINESSYRFIRTEKNGDSEINVVEATYISPEKIKETGYSKRVLYINNANGLLVKSEFWGLDGKIKKVLECSDFEFFAESQKWRPKTMHMKDLEKGTQTTLIFTNFKINKGIDPNRFTVRYLESN